MNTAMRIAALLLLLTATAAAQSKLVGVYRCRSELLRPAVIGELPEGGRFADGTKLKFHETVPLEVELIPGKRKAEYGFKSKPRMNIRKFILPALLSVKLNYGRRKKREHRWEVYEDEDHGGVAMRSQTGVKMTVRGHEVMFLDLDHDGAFGGISDGYVVKPRKKKQWFKHGEELDVRIMVVPYELEGDRIWFQVDADGFKAIISTERPDYAVEKNADYAAALAVLNAARKKLGFDPVVIDPALSDACEKHSLYCAENGETDEEEKEKPAFTPEGARAGAAAVMSEAKTMKEAVEHWLDTFFHRVEMLNPGLMTVGMGLVNGHATMDVGTTRRSRSFEPYAWPCADHEAVPISWKKGEKPSPVQTEVFSDEASLRWGYPITLTFSEGDVTKVKAKLLQGMQQLDCFMSTPESVSHPDHEDNLNTVFLTARQPLEKGTTYTVSVQAVHDGKKIERLWSFTTE